MNRISTNEKSIQIAYYDIRSKFVQRMAVVVVIVLLIIFESQKRKYYIEYVNRFFNLH